MLGLLFLIPAFAPHPASAVPSTFDCSTSPGFDLEASPEDFTLTAGATSISTITVTPKFGFTGTVDLAAVNVPPEIVSTSFSQSSLTINGGSQSSTLTFTTSSTAPVGSYSFDVNATNGILFQLRAIYVRVPAPSIGISSDKFLITLHQGDTSTVTLTLKSLYGFTGTVDLTRSVSGILFAPYAPPTSSLSTPSVLLDPNTGPVTATLRIDTVASTTPGIYSVGVTAKSTTLTETNSTGALLYVLGPNFDVDAKPSLLTVALGSSISAVIEVNGTQGFTGSVALTASIQSFFGTPPTPAIANPSVTLTTTQNATTSVIFNAGSPTTTGYYLANITGTSGHLSHSALISVNVVAEGFSLAPSPATLTVDNRAGGQASSTITLQSNNLADTVDMSVFCSPEGINASLSRDRILLPLDGSNTTTLTVSASQYTAPGSYFVSIIGNAETSFASNQTLVTVDVTGPDFSLTANPASLSIHQGSSLPSTISMTAIMGFTSSVSLSVNAPPGITATLNTATITPSQPVTLTLTAAGNAPLGPTGVLITGTSGSLSRHVIVYVTVTLPAPDFTLSATTPVGIVSGSAGTSTITATALNGFAGTVALTSTVSPAGLTCTLTPSSVALGTSGTSTLSCSSLSAATYTVTVTGTSGSLTHTATVTYTITDFTVTASPTSVAANVNSATTSTITVAPVNGFTGTVALTSSIAPVTGLTCTLSPASVTLGVSETSTLSCTGTVAGTYTVTVTGTSGSLTRTATVTVKIQDFTVAASPTTVTAVAGAAGTSMITVAPVNAFTGTVALTATVSPATGLTCTLTPASVILGASQTSTLSCNGSAGTYIVTVTGTSSGITHTATVTHTITDFTVTVSLANVAVNADSAATSTITIAPVNGFTGTVALTSTVAPAGLTCTLTPASIILGASQTSALSCTGPDGAYTVTVTGTSGSLTHSATVTVTIRDFTVTASPTAVTVLAGAAGISTTIITAVQGFTGAVALTSAVSPATGLTCTLTPTSVTLGASGTSTLSCSGSAGVYTVTVTSNSGALSHTATVTYNVEDFTIISSPTIVTLIAGSGTSTITATAFDGFTGTVALTFAISPATGLTCTLTPTSITLGAPGTSTLSCTGSAGTYTVTVTGTSSGITHAATVTYTATDFTVDASPTSVTVVAGVADTSTITVTPQNGFYAQVDFAATVSPSTGLSVSFNPPYSPYGNSPSIATLSSSTAGTYTVTITATSGSLIHSITIQVTVTSAPDFDITAGQGSLSINQGERGTTTILISPTNGFTGTVTLSSSVSPPGPTVSLSSSNVNRGSGSSTLTINVGGNVAAGTYTVTVQGASGSLSHSAAITVTVSATPQTQQTGNNILGLAPTLFYTVAGVMAALIVAGIGVAIRMRKPKTP